MHFNICNKTESIVDTNGYNRSNIKKNFYQSFNNFKNKGIKKNVILGIIEKYSLNKILPFFKSFINAKFQNCDVVMFVRYVSKEIISYLKSIGVLVFEVSEAYNKIKVINIRWKMYIEFLRERKNQYNLVLHTDVRDTFFQRAC